MSDRPEFDGTSFDGTGLLERELTRLRDDVADRAELPDFAEVETRAVRRRRTRIAGVGSVVAAAVVVAAIVLAPGLGAQREPTPAPTTDGPTVAKPGTVPEAVRDLVQDSRAHRFVVAGGLDGSIAVIWRNLVQPEPTFALVTRTADGVVTGQLIDAPFNLTAVPGGWVGTTNARHFFVRPDGITTDLRMEGAAVQPAAGDVAVPDGSGYAVFRNGRLYQAAVGSQSSAAVITGDGTLIVQAGPRLFSEAGGFVTLPESTRGVVLTGNGSHVAAVALGDDPDGGIPVIGAALSGDNGRTWKQVELSGVDSTTGPAVTSSGLTLVPNAGRPLVLISPQGEVLDVPNAPQVDLAVASGHVLYGWTQSGPGPYIGTATASGVSWELLDTDGYI